MPPGGALREKVTRERPTIANTSADLALLGLRGAPSSQITRSGRLCIVAVARSCPADQPLHRSSIYSRIIRAAQASPGGPPL